MGIREKVCQLIRQHKLIQRGDKIIVGVSGGPDSLALLHILHRLRPELGLRLSVVHFNHQLRKGALADQRHVEKVSAQLGLPCTSVNLALNKKAPPGSLEDAARQERLKHFSRLLKKEHAHSVALGHQQDDCAETVLMRILRGTGLQGLQGIRPITTIDGITVIRPLLAVTRDEILAYLKEEKIAFCRDETNAQNIFTRNKIRNELLPYLETHYQKNLRQLLCNLSLTAAEDYHYLEGAAQKQLARLTQKATRKEIRLTEAGLLRLPAALRRLVLRLAIQNLKGDMNRLTLAHTVQMEEFILTQSRGAVLDLPSGIRFSKQPGVVVLKSG